MTSVKFKFLYFFVLDCNSLKVNSEHLLTGVGSWPKNIT